MDIEFEHRQLLSSWQSIDFDRLLSVPKAPVRNLIGAGADDIGINLRKAHDLFGWKAKDELRQLGLCSGALYRTQAFMDVPQSMRCGRKIGQNVHIEHTVPVNALKGKWLDFRSAAIRDVVDGYAWLLVSTVATAFKQSQKSCLVGCSSSSYVFTRGHRHHGLPFMRYTVDAGLAGQIYNVVTRERIHPGSFSYQDHMSSIFMLLDLVGASRNFKSIMKDRCPVFLDDLVNGH